ncbi:MAG: MBL fold metallo-hydrolase [Gammaproteobacteria bacterium]|nr:MAG: MBL fold metallo-hydrolase [Gammaproteobacteria bacterium]
MLKRILFVLMLSLYAVACNADFIKVTLLGTGSPRPSVERSGPAILVEVGGKYLLFDSGRGVVQRLQQLDIRISDIQHIFITHLHSDHISALDDVWLTGWIYQRPLPLNIYGPNGTKSFVDHLGHSYSYDVQLRNQYSGLDINAGAVATNDIKPGVIFSEDGVKVTAFLVDHRPVDPAFGYRIDFGKRSVVISGDTTYSQSLVDHSLKTDLLVHEIMAVKSEILENNPRLQKIQRYHTNPEQLIKVLDSTKPRAAVMTHVIIVGTPEEEVLKQVNDGYEGELYMGEDLMSIEVGSSIKVIPYSKM